MLNNTKISYITNGALATRKLGKDLAKIVVKMGNKGPIVIGLDGNLGSGKTTFLQGFALGLGIKEKILSPTFVIAKKFKVKKRNSKYKNFWHIDCYRLGGLDDLKSLNFKDIIADEGNIIAIEWVGKIKKAIPAQNIFIEFRFLDKNKREIILSGINLNGTMKNNG